MKSRPYQGMHDFYAMLDLLTEGSKAKNGTHYAHRGDLQWWLFYSDIPLETWLSNIQLWFEAEHLMGWALLSPKEQSFDIFVLPHLRGSECEGEILEWSLEHMSMLGTFQSIWIAEQDDVRIRWLQQNGFHRAPEFTEHFKRSLSGPLDGPTLPEGFSIRSSRGEEDARLRAACSHAAFGSSKPFEEYWPRTLRFMQSPVYVPEHEIFVIAPTGQVAAYCIIWIDEVTKLGHFEPVGTHPDFQRKGLGKCLLFEGFRRLKSEGMTEADVCTNYDNPPAIGLYESVGFQKSERLLTYRKGVANDNKI
jgi:ribosomal protein S18 acetylase RimI-like enzyme